MERALNVSSRDRTSIGLAPIDAKNAVVSEQKQFMMVVGGGGGNDDDDIINKNNNKNNIYF